MASRFPFPSHPSFQLAALFIIFRGGAHFISHPACFCAAFQVILGATGTLLVIAEVLLSLNITQAIEMGDGKILTGFKPRRHSAMDIEWKLRFCSAGSGPSDNQRLWQFSSFRDISGPNTKCSPSQPIWFP